MATRIARTCDLLGITPVLGVSEADHDAPWAREREQVVLGPAHPSRSYLAAERIVQAAIQSRCSALHPGWGFLAEDPLLASLAEAHGVTFVGPPAHLMARLGDKTRARTTMAAVGLPILPGTTEPMADVQAAAAQAEAIGYPILLKAVSGGGGRGMRIVRSANALADAFGEASAEAKAAFGDAHLYIENYIEGARHLEVQIVGDRYGNVIHVGERDCSIQRHHQKLIEESPSPILSETLRERLLSSAVRAARAIGYVGAGTVEMLLDRHGDLYFMEMNARLQVEHPVSEMRSGLDLVAEQLRVAAGARLSVNQEEIALRGHAIECRLNAEDPLRAFQPSPGTITGWQLPELEGLRIDSHIADGTEIPPYYDSLLCKMIAYGEDRASAIERMLQGLALWRCEGVETTAPMHQAILQSDAFRDHRYDTATLPGWPPAKSD